MYKTEVKIYSYLRTKDEIKRVEDEIFFKCNNTGVTVKSANTSMMGASSTTTVVYQWNSKRKALD